MIENVKLRKEAEKYIENYFEWGFGIIGFILSIAMIADGKTEDFRCRIESIDLHTHGEYNEILFFAKLNLCNFSKQKKFAPEYILLKLFHPTGYREVSEIPIRIHVPDLEFPNNFPYIYKNDGYFFTKN